MAQRISEQHRAIEGHRVNVGFRDGTRVDDCLLVSTGGRHFRKVWLFVDGEDVFVPCADVIELSEAEPVRAGST